MVHRVLTFLSQTGIWFAGLALAAFLVLFWALRGAPIGQAAREEADDDAPAAGYRDRVIAAMVGGLLLIAVGGLRGAVGAGGLVAAGLRGGVRDRPDADGREPPPPARQPGPAAGRWSSPTRR